MAATKYQILYRYINETTNVPITNDPSIVYENVEEFYTKDHAIESGTENEKLEAELAKEDMIAFGNMSDNAKNDMLFAYDGTKKVRHKKWIPEKDGYVVEKWQDIDRSLIGNRGDFTKPFTTLDYETPEAGGTVVALDIKTVREYLAKSQCYRKNTKKSVYQSSPKSTSVIHVINDQSEADQINAKDPTNKYYSEEFVNKKLSEATIFELSSYDWHDFAYGVTISQSGTPSEEKAASWINNIVVSIGQYDILYLMDKKTNTDTSTVVCKGQYASTQYYYALGIAIGKNNTSLCHHYYTYYGKADRGKIEACSDPDGIYSSISIKESDISTRPVPAHYEETMDYPYAVKDTYKRIQMDPWFVLCQYGSLEAALERAKSLVEAIGMNNVKIIKIVPFDQFVKIQ